VACTYHPSDGLKLKVGGLRSRLAWTNKWYPISKITRAKRAGVMAV
jgi:hypothetical protein